MQPCEKVGKKWDYKYKKTQDKRRKAEGKTRTKVGIKRHVRGTLKRSDANSLVQTT